MLHADPPAGVGLAFGLVRGGEGLVVDRWSSAAQVLPFLLASARGQRLRMTFMALVWAALAKVS